MAEPIQLTFLKWNFFQSLCVDVNILSFIAFLDIQISNWKCKDWQHSCCFKDTNRMDIQYVICNKIAGQKISLIWHCAEQCKMGGQQQRKRCQTLSGSDQSGSGWGPAVLGNGYTEFSFNSTKMLSRLHPTKG